MRMLIKDIFFSFGVVNEEANENLLGHFYFWSHYEGIL